MDRRTYPRWEAVTTKVSGALWDIPVDDLADMLRRIHEHGAKLHAEAMEYARCWPVDYQGFGASFYETFGPNIAEMLRKKVEADPEFAYAMVRAEYDI